MLHGIGVDIVSIERMRDVVEKWGIKFLHRVFTLTEIAYCYEKKDPYPSLAVRFAAKEAVIKAIGAEECISLTDIEVSNNGNAKPVITPRGKLEQLLRQRAICSVHLSLSHDREYGIAFVTLEQKAGGDQG